ncbi:MAG: RAMP superfamily CRISPR-associated protein, partial [Candidatus Micrarchaeia archaeon]
MSNTPYSLHRFILMTLDPLHIGTGGYRLGRVDLSIVREPGTNLPKVPGTSLSGAIRQYAAMRYGKMGCAGQKGCGQSTCPICYTFGSAKESGGGYAGTVNIFDARLLLFPVHTLAGPAWVTSPSALADFGINGHSVSTDRAKWPNSLTLQSRLNLGWLMLEREDGTWQPPVLNHVPQEVQSRMVLVSDKLFSQVVNSNLEVRTSVSIDPTTGAA